MRSKFEIKIGDTFGKWTVLQKAEPTIKIYKRGGIPKPYSYSRWLCRCSCGIERSVRQSLLKRGGTRSCGSRKCNREDLVGQIFGRLTVICYTHTDNLGHSHWLARCECGKEIDVLASNLKKNHTKSCGCLKFDVNSLPYGEAAFRNLYGTYKRNAKRRSRELVFDLSEDFFKYLISQNCYYCFCEPYKIAKSKNGILIYNGIDRVDNDIGYIEGNVVPCCTECNFNKKNVSIKIARKMIEFLDSKDKTLKNKQGGP